MIGELREALAELMHAQWSNWTQHMLLGTDADREKWKLQAATPCRELSENDKEKDRREADKVIHLITRAGVDVAGLVKSVWDDSPFEHTERGRL